MDDPWFEARYPSPLGELLLASRGEALCGLWMEGQRHYCFGLTQPGVPRQDLPVFRLAAQWLDAYFQQKNPAADAVPLQPEGTLFQREVWDCLRGISYGETVTYGDLCRQMGRTAGSARAVGAAVGRNPIAILIPCHRVIGGDGSLTGYAGGLDNKRRLLSLEGICV